MHKKFYALALALFFCNISNLYAAQVLFSPALVVSEEYTDNLFLSYQNKEHDFITFAGVDLSSQMLWRTAGIELSYNPTYNSYSKYDEFNYWRHEAGLRMWKQYSQSTRLEFQDTYLRTNDPGDQSSNVEQDGQPQGPVIEADRNRRGRNEYYTNVAEARLDHQFGANDRVYVAYQYSILRDIDTISGMPVNDNNIATPAIGLTYDFSPRWGVETNSSYAMTDYKDQNDRNEYNGNLRLLFRFQRAYSGYINYRHTIMDFPQNTEENYSIYEPSLGIRYESQHDALIEIGAGYYIQDFETLDDQEGFNVSSDISKKWNYRNGYLGISGGSGYLIDDNGTEDNGLDIYYQGRVEVGHNFTPKLTGSAFIGYRYDEYPDATPDKVEKSATAGLNFDWQALQWMVIGLTYSYKDLNSDIEADQYTENRALLTIRIAPASPYRWN